jgi:CPA2 family monovalent cation:H+ antiporter-2
MVAGVVALILVGKSLVSLGIVLLMGYPLSTALVVSASLAQIGEFSFILAGLGVAHGLLTAEGMNLVLAGALISITLNPLVFAGADRACQWVRAHPALRRRFEEERQASFAVLEKEMAAAREAAAAKAAAHRTFTPEELLERFPLFTGLTPEQREVLVLHFETRSAQPGERIIRAGEKADVVYFISEGQVEVAVAGQRIALGAGDYFGEMALLHDQPRSADVTALDFSKFVTLNQRDFRQFLRRFPEIRQRIAAQAAERGEKIRQWQEGSGTVAPEATRAAE